MGAGAGRGPHDSAGGERPQGQGRRCRRHQVAGQGLRLPEQAGALGRVRDQGPQLHQQQSLRVRLGLTAQALPVRRLGFVRPPQAAKVLAVEQVQGGQARRAAQRLRGAPSGSLRRQSPGRRRPASSRLRRWPSRSTKARPPKYAATDRVAIGKGPKPSWETSRDPSKAPTKSRSRRTSGSGSAGCPPSLASLPQPPKAVPVRASGVLTQVAPVRFFRRHLRLGGPSLTRRVSTLAIPIQPPTITERAQPQHPS
jgi:hypothetical protein